MAERVYVTIDLETTGLDAHQDAIIEIGAVKFSVHSGLGDTSIHILERFVTFVNPKRSIPLFIRQLTGISDADVADSPSIEAVIPELLSFVTPNVSAVVAHNAGFDIGFLEAAGVDFHRPVQDTFELASILLPRMASYNLGELCRALDIILPDAHRALDDAEAAANLFVRLLDQIHSLPKPVVSTLLSCGDEVKWSPLLLFTDAFGERTIGDSLLPRAQSESSPDSDKVPNVVPDSLLLDQGPITAVVDPASVEKMFAPEGPLHRAIDSHYEYRIGQTDMALRVLETLNKGDHLLVEAGTGTGKSIAYLLPSSLWSTANERRVVIATNTIALQDQLIEKDIPIVREILSLAGLARPRTALLKGRTNYICTRRLHLWYRNRRLSPLELRVLARVLVWLPTTSSGDVSEVFLPTPAERAIWSQVCSDTATCSAEKCTAPVHDDLYTLDHNYRDYYLRARQCAETSHLLVVNHALLLADVESGSRILPPYSHLIVDEAHRLEEATTDQLTYRVEWNQILSSLSLLCRDGNLGRVLLRAVRAKQDPQGAKLSQELAVLAQNAISSAKDFAARLLIFARGDRGFRTDFQYSQRLALDLNLRTQPAWSEVEIDWDQASHRLRAAIEKISAVIHHLEEMQWWKEDTLLGYLRDLENVSRGLHEAADWLDRIVFQGGSSGREELVTWIEVDDTQASATLVAAPLFVSEIIEKEIVHRKRCALFTGATLRTGSGFTFIRDRLGLWDVTAATVDSPFDYETSTLLFMPSDLPEPNHSQYQHAVEQAIIQAAISSSGATMALFTSYAQLRMTADAVRSQLDRVGITVFQHGTSSRQRLLRDYRRTEKAVLLGTRSFWEGIDLPGDELRCLLIVRLPFAVPSDPIVAARSSELENPFQDYTLPDAIIRFRQGFGRLIRSATDRGIVVILDSRMWRKPYGRAFLESLPPCTMRHAPLANLPNEVEQWLQRSKSDNRDYA